MTKLPQVGIESQPLHADGPDDLFRFWLEDKHFDLAAADQQRNLLWELWGADSRKMKRVDAAYAVCSDDEADAETADGKLTETMKEVNVKFKRAGVGWRVRRNRANVWLNPPP